MAYGDYLKTVSEAFDQALRNIAVVHNFDYGDEFEVAICEVLRQMLPQRYGVCRGFAVADDGNTAGDDIIIFDQERFPTFRLMAPDDYSKKQRIPVEAIYAYIEAKYTLTISGSGPQSLEKAWLQASAIKRLPREQIPLSVITPYHKISSASVSRPEFFPQYLNPLFSLIASRHVRLEIGGDRVPPETFVPHFRAKIQELESQTQYAPPDLVVAGGALAVPVRGNQIKSPFNVPGSTRLRMSTPGESAYGIALSVLSWALDNIQLGGIWWNKVIADGLGIPVTNADEE